MPSHKASNPVSRKPATKKSSKLQKQTVVLVKLRRYYVPADVESYRTLHRLHVPCVRFHEDMIDTLKLLPISLIGRPFEDVFNEFEYKLEQAWTKNPQRRFIKKPNQFILDTKDLSKVRVSVPAVETTIRKFFARWGYAVTTEFSETPTRAKLVVSYKYDPSILPQIEFLEA